MMLHFLKSMIHNSIAPNENHITFASEKKINAIIIGY